MKKMLLLVAAMCSSFAAMAATSTVERLAQKRAAADLINEENPNNCLMVTTIEFREDSIPVEKADYKYNANRDISAVINYEMTDTGWLCLNFTFFDYLYLPNDSTNTYFVHERNRESGEWLPTQGYKVQTIMNGNEVTKFSWEALSGDSTQWEYRAQYWGKQVVTYNADGQVLEAIEYAAEDGQLVPSTKYENEYNAEGNRIMDASYVWMDGAWKPYMKDEEIVTDTSYFRGSYYHDENYESFVLTNSVYERYDADGNKILYIWGADGDRIYLKEEYTYENGALTSMTQYKEGYSAVAASSLLLSEKNFYQTDEHKRVIECKTLSYNYGSVYAASCTRTTYAFADTTLLASTEQLDSVDGAWVPSTKSEYTYSASRLPLTTLTYSYDRKAQTWVNQSKDETVYNSDDYVLYDASYTWDAEANRWQGVSKRETEYDAEGVPVSDITYSMNYGDTAWIPERAVVRMFDVYGNFLGEGWYVRDELTGAWVNRGKQLLVYICGDIPTPAQPVVVEPGHDFVTFAWLSYEDADTYTLTVLSSDRTDTIAIMNFNSYGELMDQRAPLGMRRSAALPSSSSVFTCLIEGLEAGTNYCFVMEAKDAEAQVVHSTEGLFNTEGMVNALEEVETVAADGEKLLMNGELFIRHGNHWYNAQGQRIN